jgi:hypothetical protein
VVWFLTLHKLSFACPRTVSHDGPAPSAFGVCTERRECVAPHPCSWNRRPSRSVARFVDSPCRIPLFMSTTAAMTSRLPPLGPGFLGPVYERAAGDISGWSALDGGAGALKVFRTMAARTGRLGRMSSVHAGDHPVAEAEVGIVAGSRLRISSCYLARTDTTARPRLDGRAWQPSSRWITRTARSRMAQC